MRFFIKIVMVVLLFLVVGKFSVNAQDLIILRNGNVIEAIVVELSTSEIRYRNYDHLDGPIIVIPTINVISIRYENGRLEFFNTTPTADVTENNNITSAMDPDKLTFGINIDPSGFALYGPSVSIEFTKGKLNTQIDIRFPSLGLLNNGTGVFGVGLGFNYFHHTRTGGFYLGGMYEYSHFIVSRGEWYSENVLVINTGYKFVLSSDIYFRIGGYLGGGLSFGLNGRYNRNGPIGMFVFRPDLTIGYNF